MSSESPYVPFSPAVKVDDPTVRGCRILLDGRYWVGVLTLVNAMLGAGILAYPYAFMSAGMALAAGLSAVVGALSFCSLSVIMMTMAKANSNTTRSAPVRSYGDLIRHGCGPRTASAVEVMICLYGLGANVGYLILLGDVVTPSLIAAGVGVEEATLRLVVLLSSAAICALLCMLRNLSALKYAAAAAVLAVGFTVAMLIRQALLYPCEHGDCIDECGRPGWCDANSTTSSATGVYAAPPSVASVFQALPLIAFALQCHIQSALCWSELPPRLQGDAATRKIGLGAVVLVLVLYIPTGIAGFARFGGATQGDILNNFGTADGLADIARVCIAITALSAFPSQHFPARVALWRWYKELCGCRRRSGGRDSRLYLNTGDVQPSPSTMTRNAQLSNVSEILDDDLSLAAAAEEDAGAPLGFIVVESVVWVAVVAVVAQALGSALSQVFALIGAICGGTVIFLVPGLLWANLGGGAPASAKRIVPAAVLIAVALFIMCAGTAVTLEQMVTQGVGGGDRTCPADADHPLPCA